MELNGLECGECGKKYKDAECLNLHIIMKHKGDQIKLEVMM